jgi:hypothetical protein
MFFNSVFVKKPNICFVIPYKPWYDNENILIVKQSNIEQMFINGIENALLISSFMICYSVITGNPSHIVKNLNRLSSKFMNFNNFYFSICFN